MKAHPDISTIFVEFCRACNTHSWCTHHEEEKYISYFQKFSTYIHKHYPHLHVIGNFIPQYLIPLNGTDSKFYNSKTKKYVNFPGIGAFQITYQGQEIFSKKKTNTWPNFHDIMLKIQQISRGGHNRQQKSIGDEKGHNLEEQSQQSNNGEESTDRQTLTFMTNEDNEAEDKRATFYGTKKAKEFTLTDHFKIYKMNKLEDKNKTQVNSLKKQKKSEPILKLMEGNKTSRRKSWDNFSIKNQLTNMFKEKGYVNEEKGKKEMIINLDSIEEQTFIDENVSKRQREKQRNNSREVMKKWDEQLNFLQHKFRKVQNSLSKIKQKNKEFDNSYLNLQAEWLQKINKAQSQSQNNNGIDIKFLNPSFVRQGTQMSPQQSRALLYQLQHQEISPKFAQIDKYIYSSTEEKNKRLHQIYGEQKLLKRDPCAQSRYLQPKKKYSESDSENEEQVKSAKKKRSGEKDDWVQLPQIQSRNKNTIKLIRNQQLNENSKLFKEIQNQELESSTKKEFFQKSNEKAKKFTGGRNKQDEYFMPDEREEVDRNSVKTSPKQKGRYLFRRVDDSNEKVPLKHSLSEKKNKFVKTSIDFGNKMKKIIDKKDKQRAAREGFKEKFYAPTSSRTTKKQHNPLLKNLGINNKKSQIQSNWYSQPKKFLKAKAINSKTLGFQKKPNEFLDENAQQEESIERTQEKWLEELEDEQQNMDSQSGDRGEETSKNQSTSHNNHDETISYQTEKIAPKQKQSNQTSQHDDRTSLQQKVLNKITGKDETKEKRENKLKIENIKSMQLDIGDKSSKHKKVEKNLKVDAKEKKASNQNEGNVRTEAENQNKEIHQESKSDEQFQPDQNRQSKITSQQQTEPKIEVNNKKVQKRLTAQKVVNMQVNGNMKGKEAENHHRNMDTKVIDLQVANSSRTNNKNENSQQQKEKNKQIEISEEKRQNADNINSIKGSSKQSIQPKTVSINQNVFDLKNKQSSSSNKQLVKVSEQINDKVDIINNEIISDQKTKEILTQESNNKVNADEKVQNNKRSSKELKIQKVVQMKNQVNPPQPTTKQNIESKDQGGINANVDRSKSQKQAIMQSHKQTQNIKILSQIPVSQQVINKNSNENTQINPTLQAHSPNQQSADKNKQILNQKTDNRRQQKTIDNIKQQAIKSQKNKRVDTHEQGYEHKIEIESQQKEHKLQQNKGGDGNKEISNDSHYENMGQISDNNQDNLEQVVNDKILVQEDRKHAINKIPNEITKKEPQLQENKKEILLMKQTPQEKLHETMEAKPQIICSSNSNKMIHSQANEKQNVALKQETVNQNGSTHTPKKQQQQQANKIKTEVQITDCHRQQAYKNINNVSPIQQLALESRKQNMGQRQQQIRKDEQKTKQNVVRIQENIKDISKEQVDKSDVSLQKSVQSKVEEINIVETNNLGDNILKQQHKQNYKPQQSTIVEADNKQNNQIIAPSITNVNQNANENKIEAQKQSQNLDIAEHNQDSNAIAGGNNQTLTLQEQQKQPPKHIKENRSIENNQQLETVQIKEQTVQQCENITQLLPIQSVKLRNEQPINKQEQIESAIKQSQPESKANGEHSKKLEYSKQKQILIAQQKAIQQVGQKVTSVQRAANSEHELEMKENNEESSLKSIHQIKPEMQQLNNQQKQEQVIVQLPQESNEYSRTQKYENGDKQKTSSKKNNEQQHQNEEVKLEINNKNILQEGQDQEIKEDKIEKVKQIMSSKEENKVIQQISDSSPNKKIEQNIEEEKTIAQQNIQNGMVQNQKQTNKQTVPCIKNEPQTKISNLQEKKSSQQIINQNEKKEVSTLFFTTNSKQTHPYQLQKNQSLIQSIKIEKELGVQNQAESFKKQDKQNKCIQNSQRNKQQELSNDEKSSNQQIKNTPAIKQKEQAIQKQKMKQNKQDIRQPTQSQAKPTPQNIQNKLEDIRVETVSIGVQKYDTSQVGFQISPDTINETFIPTQPVVHQKSRKEVPKHEAYTSNIDEEECIERPKFKRNRVYSKQSQQSSKREEKASSKYSSRKKQQQQQDYICSESSSQVSYVSDEQQGRCRKKSERFSKEKNKQPKLKYPNGGKNTKRSYKQEISSEHVEESEVIEDYQDTSRQIEKQQMKKTNPKALKSPNKFSQPPYENNKQEKKSSYHKRNSFDDHIQMLPLASSLKQQKRQMKVERALITKQIYGKQNQAQKQKFNKKSKTLNDFSKSYKSQFEDWKDVTSIFKNALLFKKQNISCTLLNGNENSSQSLQRALGILSYLNQYLIIRLFENKDQPLPDDGVYGIWLCDHYVWKCFAIDGKIPVDHSGQPFGLTFKQNCEKQLWIYLLEKALAICLGGYQELQNAQTSKILHMLTGSNILSYKIREDPEKNNKLFDLIKNCTGKNFFMNCEKSLSNMRALQQNYSRTPSIFRIENAKSINNEQKVIQICEIKGQKQNKFWMKFDKFVQQFKSVEVLQLRMNHNSCKLSLENDKGTFAIACLNFDNESLGSIAVSNKHKSGYIKVYLYREEKSNTLKLVGQAKQKSKNQLFFDCYFSIGRYYVFVEVEYKGCIISYSGEGFPTMEFKQEIRVDGYRNDFTQYLPINKNFHKENPFMQKTHDSRFIDTRMREQGQSMSRTKSKMRDMRPQQIDQLRQTFINFLVNSQAK